MKRMLCLIAALAVLLSAPPAALADTAPRDIRLLTDAEIRQTPKGMHHYMLICVDSWATDLNDLGFTDGLVLVTVDEVARRVMLTSFIRDMLISRPHVPDDAGQHAADYTPGQISDTYTFGRINYIAQKIGNARKNGEKLYTVGQAFDTLIDTINRHFDLRIEDYIVVDFRQVQNIVDALGGVDVELTAHEASYLANKNAISRDATTPALAGAGVYHLPGYVAVIYMRCRGVINIEGESQDLGRTRRARIVLTAIADSLKNATYEEAQRLLNVVTENTLYTNMTASDLLEAMNLALELKGTPVEGIRMPVSNRELSGSFEGRPYAGMATQQLDFEKNREALWSFLLNSFIVADDEE